MGGMGVVAEQVAGTVGVGTDHRDGAQARPERQAAVVGEQHNRAARDFPRQQSVFRIGQHRGVRLHERILEQPELELGPQDSRDGGVDGGFRDSPRGDGIRQRAGEECERRELNVDSRFEGHRGSLGAVLRHVVGADDLVDTEVVRDHHAIEAPAVSKHVGQQEPRRYARQAVDIVVGVHHRADACLADRGLKGKQECIVQLPAADVRRGVVQSTLGQPMPDHVLAGGDDVLSGAARVLEPVDVGGPENRNQIRVFSVGLLDSTPPRVASDIENWGEYLVRTGGA